MCVDPCSVRLCTTQALIGAEDAEAALAAEGVEVAEDLTYLAKEAADLLRLVRA